MAGALSGSKQCSLLRHQVARSVRPIWFSDDRLYITPMHAEALITTVPGWEGAVFQALREELRSHHIEIDDRTWSSMDNGEQSRWLAHAIERVGTVLASRGLIKADDTPSQSNRYFAPHWLRGFFLK